MTNSQIDIQADHASKTEARGGLIFVEHFFDVAKLNALPWQPFREAVEQYPLYLDRTPEKSGPSAKLLHLRPGCKIPFHVHTGFEYIITLDGTHQDRSGISRAGTLLVNKPNSGHSAICESGAVILAIYEKPVCFCDESVATKNVAYHDDYLVLHNIFNISRLRTLPWKTFTPGIEESLVSRDTTSAKTGASSKFLRFLPGGRELRHEYTDYAHMLLLEGSLINQGIVHGPGTLIIHEPNTAGQTESKTGCVALVIYHNTPQFSLEKKVE